jgi:hypothetical protein
MKRLVLLIAVVACGIASGSGVLSQTPTPTATPNTDRSITANRVIGEVTAVDSTAQQVTIKSDSGILMKAIFDGKTLYFRTRPGALDLEGAVAIALADVHIGDRVYARGPVNVDQKSIATTQLVVMTKADIAEKQDRDREDWRRRGVVGTVSGVNPETKEIVLQVRGIGTSQPITIAAGGSNLKFRRYAPDSVRFADAKSSSFADIRVGDQLRAKGAKNDDGIHFAAEEIVSGAFLSTRGSVVSVEPQSNEIKVKDLTTGKTMTIVVSKDSMVRRLPAEFVQRLAMRGQRAGGPPGETAGGATETQQRPQGENGPRRRPEGAEGAGPGPGGRRRMGGGMDVQEMLERMPAVTVAELKPGEMVIVSSTVGADPTRVTAIALITGLEALLQGPSGARTNGAPGTSLGLPSGALDVGIGLP